MTLPDSNISINPHDKGRFRLNQAVSGGLGGCEAVLEGLSTALRGASA